MHGSDLWDRQRHRDRRPLLLGRNRLLAAMRAWFAGEGFVEAEPAVLVGAGGRFKGRSGGR